MEAGLSWWCLSPKLLGNKMNNLSRHAFAFGVLVSPHARFLLNVIIKINPSRASMEISQYWNLFPHLHSVNRSIHKVLKWLLNDDGDDDDEL